MANPPWISAKRNINESVVLDGVYDDRGIVLESTFKIAGIFDFMQGKCLSPTNRDYCSSTPICHKIWG